jgi:redox-sensitive bicupin YhaK (pirin superfamily)
MSKQATAPEAESRAIVRIVRGQATRDGAGVELTRVIGQPDLDMLDPFLLLDAFRSDRPEQYIAGFPPHPHRGFETVTYLLAGRLRHKDSAGHEGVIEAGGIQWMTAGRGIVHSEMPEQENGLLEGFQLWINLPAAHKMDAPVYREHAADGIPEERRSGSLLRVLAGTTSRGTRGAITQPLTEPLYLDVRLDGDGRFIEALPATHNAFVYVIEGVVRVPGEDGPVELARDQLGVFGQGRQVQLQAGGDNARLLLIAGRPLKEPVARGGPFVMNTRAEITQAYRDYEQGRM